MTIEMEEYQLFKQNGVNKRGGVALFVVNSIKYKTMDHMSKVIDDLMKSVTIEISNGRAKNMIITCIYRT